MTSENLTLDEAQYRRALIAEQHPDAPGVALRREAFIDSVVLGSAQMAAQIEAARLAEVQAEARRSKWSDQLHEKNIHD